MTAREAAAAGFELSSTHRIGNTLVYFVKKDGKPIGSVWRWSFKRGGTYGAKRWATGYKQPSDSEPRALTGWRASTRTALATEILQADGSPFATRFDAAAALAGLTPTKKQRVRYSS
jgi:hypothetical protein